MHSVIKLLVLSFLLQAVPHTVFLELRAPHVVAQSVASIFSHHPAAPSPTQPPYLQSTGGELLPGGMCWCHEEEL